jgi:hypothetical protein
MRLDVAASSKQLSALSRLFSSAVVRELAAKGKSAAFVRLICQADLLPLARSALVRDAFETAFALLQRVGSRDEYIYKAALTHRVLMGRHSLRTACMLTEFRTGDCKADIAILNGTTTVYEIKSERDSLSRLERQIDNYRKVFASVVVIAGENHVEYVLDATPPDVGVMSLSPRYSITTRREARNSPSRICPVAVFEALQSSEANHVLMELGVPVPKVPNTLLRSELRKLFAPLRPEDVHEAMLRTLKRTRAMRPLEAFIARLPRSLQPAALSVPLRKSDHDRLVSAVNTPLRQALEW